MILFLNLSFTLGYGNDWEMLLQLKGQWKFNIGDNLKWADPAYDDSNWENMAVPSAWEDQGFHGYDGYAWYRKRFNGSGLSRTNNDYYIFLGYIDDVDQVYFNGQLIGASGSFPPRFTTAYKALRRYLIPKDLINTSGTNVISVRVFDVTNVGGIVSGEVGIFTPHQAVHLQIDLQGLWAFTKGDKSIYRERYFNDEGWRQIMVPSPWENQGIGRYDGFAWYRKSFIPGPDISKERMVLIMGKIDDFDEVYVNGKLVGSTNDKQPFGRSTSYQKLRIYPLPEGIFIPNQHNSIAVRVYDLGHNGGIYEGPIGLIKDSNLARFVKNK
ncbi:hypothetical protein BH23BAC1_BH23BAC1_24200 [soil metagenome]